MAAFYPIAYAAERVDPRAEVDNLTPPGAEPHDLELSARDVEHVLGADTVLYFGEGFMPALEKAVEGDDRAVDLLAGQQLLQGAEGGETVADPHVWLDPARYAQIVRKIGSRARQAARRTRPRRSSCSSSTVSIGRGSRHCERHAIVTSHAAFGYLASAYGLEQVPLTGIAPEAEPSAKAIEALVERGASSRARRRCSSKRSSRPSWRRRSRARPARGRPCSIPLEGLTKDESANGADYFSLMRANLAALRKALGCS